MHYCTRRVADLLRVKELSLHDLPDNRFDSLPLLDVIKLVERSIQCWQAAVLYTHHAGDLNIDHQVVNRAVLTAARPVPGQSVREVYMFEVPSSTEWTFQQLAPVFKPNVFVNIEDTLPLKLEGMQFDESEIRKFPTTHGLPKHLRRLRGDGAAWWDARRLKRSKLHSSFVDSGDGLCLLVGCTSMKVLLLHANGSPWSGLWNQTQWDLIADLGFARQYSMMIGAAVRSLDPQHLPSTPPSLPACRLEASGKQKGISIPSRRDFFDGLMSRAAVTPPTGITMFL